MSRNCKRADGYLGLEGERIINWEVTIKGLDEVMSSSRARFFNFHVLTRWKLKNWWFLPSNKLKGLISVDEMLDLGWQAKMTGQVINARSSADERSSSRISEDRCVCLVDRVYTMLSYQISDQICKIYPRGERNYSRSWPKRNFEEKMQVAIKKKEDRKVRRLEPYNCTFTDPRILSIRVAYTFTSRQMRLPKSERSEKR